MIVDKIDACLFLFAANGTLRATTPVLLGLARGDDSPPRIGTRKLSAITPAGRFIVEPGHNLASRDLLWIDYDASGAACRSRSRRSISVVRASSRVGAACTWPRSA